MMPDRKLNAETSHCMRRLMVIAGLSALIRLVHAAPADAGEGPGATIPTFTREVAPILFKHCVRCHRPDGSAADIPLLSYDAVIKEKKEVRDKVGRREMPPWPADPGESLPFRNDPRLTQRDIDTVLAWIDAGAPKGNDADLPTPPTFSKGWLHPDARAPDAVISLPKFNIRANGTVPYIQQLIKVPFTEDKWVSALQVRAGNARLMHHMGITEVSLPPGITPEVLAAMDKLGQQVGAPSGRLQIQQVVVSDPANPGAYDMLGVYAPGTTFETYGDDAGKLIRGGNNLYINFNIHYTTTGRDESDESQLALWYTSKHPKHVLFRAPSAVASIIANGRELLTDDPGTKAEGTPYALPPIQANTAKYELIGITAYARPITIYQLQPHAHVRATDFRYTAVFPDGRELSLLSTPHYSYHFQMEYALATPLTLPAGSKLVVTAHYDNSASNENLGHLGTNEAARKCGPENVAYFGQQNQSWDEMFSPLIQYSVDEKAKARKLVTAVGCLVRSHSGWSVDHGSPVRSTETQGTSSTELAATAATPFGVDHYRLIGADVFDPTSRMGRKVVIKGMLIQTKSGSSINVTSLQPAASDCRR